MLRCGRPLRHRLLLSSLRREPPLLATPITAFSQSHRCLAAAAFSTLSIARRWCGTATASGDSSSSTEAPPLPPKRKVQIAVVGSGPSGCFVAAQLVKKHPDLHVDIFERMPVPFGLCRYGVAPDHPDVKNVEKQFLELFQSGRVTWIGNVSIGKEIPVRALLSHYAAVVFATGADGSKKLRIPGEDLAGVIPARSFVEYYNAYPFPFGSPHFCPFDLDRTQKAVVIGNGNVAMDVVRVLGGSYKYFAPTDMNALCVKELMKNRIEEVSIVARRGVKDSAFAIAEFRELTKYQNSNVTVAVDTFSLEKATASVPVGKTARAHKRMMELVHQHALSAEDTAEELARLATDKEGVPLPSAVAASAHHKESAPVPEEERSKTTVRPPCTLRFRYHLTPVAILPSRHRRNRVGGVLFKKTRTPAAPGNENSEAAPVHGETEEEYCVLPCDVVMTSIGYRSDSVPEVPFDHAAGVIANDCGRVRGLPRVYCAGWVKNGAKGVILHSVVDAQETVAAILSDMEAGSIPTEATADVSSSSGATSVAFRPPPSSPVTEDEATQEVSGKPPLLKVEQMGTPFTSTPRPSTADFGKIPDTTTMTGKYGLVDYFVEKKLQPVSMAGLQRIFYVEHQRGVDLGKKSEKIAAVGDMLDVAMGGELGRKADERLRSITPARSDALMYLKELLDDDTDLSSFAKELAKDMPHKLAQSHPLGRIAPNQL